MHLTSLVIGHVPGFGRNAHQDREIIVGLIPDRAGPDALKRSSSHVLPPLPVTVAVATTQGAPVQTELPGEVSDHPGLVLPARLEDVVGLAEVDVVLVR